jgi:capsular exopolysaccharide synthesis family protein
MMVADEADPHAHPHALSVLWQRKGLIGSLVAVSTLLAAGTLQVIQPRYTAETLVALNTRASAKDELLTTKPTVVAPPLASVLVATEKDILESRGLATSVVEALALDRDPEFNRSLKPSVLPPSLRAAWHRMRAWMGEQPKDDKTATVDEVMDRLGVKNGPDSFVIRVTFDSEEPRKAALVANAFADLYIRRQREAKFAEMQLATDWIGKQIETLRDQISKDSLQAVEFRRKHGLAPADARDKGQVTAQTLVALNTELATTQRERAEAEAALSQARRELHSGGNLVALTFVDDSPFLQEIRKEEAKVLGRIAELQAGYREDSPAVSTLKQQLSSLRGEIEREVGKQVDGLANKAAQAKAREDAILARIKEVTGHNASSDQALAEVEQRERDITAKNQMLDSFLTRYSELTNRTEVEDPDARIASRATAPAKPSFPKPFLFLGVAFTGSLGMGITIAFLLERFRAGFQTTRQLREMLGLATLGIIPDISRQPGHHRPADALVDRPESVYAEAVRSAQLAIMNACGTAAGMKQAASGTLCMAITSSMPAEGKTAFAVSLGRSLALAEKKVLLVDCDLRRPSVARQLNSYELPGLADFLRETASLDEIVRHDPRSGLDFIASGGRASDPQKLLDDPRLGDALRQLMGRYDVVLLDTPPTMVALDVALVAPYARFAVYVVEWDRTPRRAVEAGIEHLKSFDVPVAGVVLSKVDLDKQRHYSDYVDFCFRSAEYYGN